MAANDPKRAHAEGRPGAEPTDDATSSETLADLEATQKLDTPTDTGASGQSGDAPAPDGTPDPDGGATADGRDSGGPM